MLPLLSPDQQRRNLRKINPNEVILKTRFNKWFLIFVGLLIASAWITILIQSTSLYDIHGFDFTTVKSIRIYDHGLLGTNVIEINDRDQILQIGRLINSSEKISSSDYIPSANTGLCDLDLISKNSKKTSITVTRNIHAGGIITSGQWSYKSDSLLSIIVKELSKSN